MGARRGGRGLRWRLLGDLRLREGGRGRGGRISERLCGMWLDGRILRGGLGCWLVGTRMRKKREREERSASESRRVAFSSCVFLVSSVNSRIPTPPTQTTPCPLPKTSRSSHHLRHPVRANRRHRSSSSSQLTHHPPPSIVLLHTLTRSPALPSSNLTPTALERSERENGASPRVRGRKSSSTSDGGWSGRDRREGRVPR